MFSQVAAHPLFPTSCATELGYGTNFLRKHMLSQQAQVHPGLGFTMLHLPQS